MSFLSLLRSGVTVEKVASEFVQNLFNKSEVLKEFSLEIAASFVTECLAAIGITCNITADQLNQPEKNFPWPLKELNVYVFHCNEGEFKIFEHFLVLICSMSANHFELQLPTVADIEDKVDTAIDYLMYLLACWRSVHIQLKRMEESNKRKHFEEPIARINFHFLLGFNDLRQKYCSAFPTLDKICHFLYIDALPGLYYKKTHELILNGLLKLFEEDFHFFYRCLKPNYMFYYEAFLVKYESSTTHSRIYKSLQNLLRNEEDELNVLTALLIQQPMLDIYYTTLVRGTISSVFTKIEALNFLKLLQEKLVVLDVFTYEFIESILGLVLKKNQHLSERAAELYVILMRKKFDNQLILLHIIYYYAHRNLTPHNLNHCVRQLSKYFDCFMKFGNFLQIICNEVHTDTVRSHCAQILLMMAKIKIEISASSVKLEIEQLMLIIPGIIEQIKCQNTILILLEIFDLFDIKEWPKQCIDNFIGQTLDIFFHLEKNFDYLVLMKISNIFHNCLLFNKEWNHLSLIIDSTVLNFQQLRRNLREVEDKKQMVENKNLVIKYCELLKRVNIMVKIKYNLFDNLMEMISTLEAQFLQKTIFKDFIEQNKSFIDIYALEIICSCILKAYRIERNKGNIRKHGINLIEHIWQLVVNVKELLKQPVVRIKSYFYILLILMSSPLFKLEYSVYNKCLEILLALNFSRYTQNLKDGNESTQMHPVRCLQYKKYMLHLFTQFHKIQRIDIQTNTIWKLCIYYGFNDHKFNKELEELLITLAEHRMNIFKHILPVVIYNLYRRKPVISYKQIVLILENYKKLIDNHKRIESPSSMNVHVVLLILQMTEKVLDVQPISSNNNRLKALNNLDIFLRDVDFRQSDIAITICEQMDKLKKTYFTKKEREVWQNLRNKLENLQK
uniref:Uncharacterized protein n=1 Tax=Glossina brevipalpis TaxID=37001 RepID=A0A1A9WLD6_9MUSC